MKHEEKAKKLKAKINFQHIQEIKRLNQDIARKKLSLRKIEKFRNLAQSFRRKHTYRN